MVAGVGKKILSFLPLATGNIFPRVAVGYTYESSMSAISFGLAFVDNEDVVRVFSRLELRGTRCAANSVAGLESVTGYFVDGG